MDETAPPAVDLDPLEAVLAKLDEKARGYDAPREWIQNLSPLAHRGLSVLN